MESEREAKFDVDVGFQLPDLEDAAGIAVGPAGQTLLKATYYDTAGLDLARWGVTLRHRAPSGSTGKWTVKLPSDLGRAPGLLSRTEVDFQGGSETVPREASDFVRDFTRGRQLREICRLTTTRTISTLTRRDEREPFAELDDDKVEYETPGGATGRFREMEVELEDGFDGNVPPQLADALEAAGARAGTGEPKVLRAIGWEPPPLPPQKLGKDSTTAELTSYAIGASLRRLLFHLPLVRTTQEPEPVHQARVAARRLRSDLSTLGEVLKRKPQRRMRSGLRELGRRLGSLRDADVMAGRLGESVSKLSDEEQQEAGAYLERIDQEREVLRTRVLDYINSPRCATEIDRLVEALDKPPVWRPHVRARRILPPLVARRWNRLKRRVDRLGAVPSDRKLHRVRIEAKRCRYAAELAVPVLGKDASRLADALADVQSALGEVHDAVVLEAWLRDASKGLPAQLAAVARSLIDQERARSASARRDWEEAWRVITDGGLADWIS